MVWRPGPLKLFVTIYNDARLLPHFLRHYAAIGVGRFLMAVPAELRENVEGRIENYPVDLFTNFDLSRSVFDMTAVTEMRLLHQDATEWVVIVDLDEFIECPDLLSVVALADAAGVDVVRGIMHDRFSANGLLADVSTATRLSETFPVKSRFIRDVMKGCDHKGVLVKGHLLPAALHHRFEGERVFADVLEISHYKWISGAVERLRNSHRLVAEEAIAWSTEYQRVLDHFDAHGRFAWESFGGRLAGDFRSEPPPGHCAVCGAALSEAEVEFSTGRFGRMLCRGHQQSIGVQFHPED